MRKIFLSLFIFIICSQVSFASSVINSVNNNGPISTIAPAVSNVDRPGSKGKEVLKDLYIPKAMNEANGVGVFASFYSQQKGKPYKLIDVYSYYEYEPSSWIVNNFNLDKIDASLHGKLTKYNRYNGIDTCGEYLIDLMDANGNIETIWLYRMARINTEINCVHPVWLFDEQFNEVLLFDYLTLKEKRLELSDFYKTKSQAYKYWLEQGHADKSWIKVYCDPVDWD